MKQHYFLRLLFILVFGFLFNADYGQAPPKLPETKLLLPDKTHTITFVWKGEMINKRCQPFAAMLLPVKLSNCPKVFYMQFDTGSPYSMFYQNKLPDIQAKYADKHRLND